MATWFMILTEKLFYHDSKIYNYEKAIIFYYHLVTHFYSTVYFFLTPLLSPELNYMNLNQLS